MIDFPASHGLAIKCLKEKNGGKQIFQAGYGLNPGNLYSVPSDHKEMLQAVIKFREKLEKLGKLMFDKLISSLSICITLFSNLINYNFLPGN